ncbi:MAG: pre-peptidase C-terminal domain-containing protein [Capsulimonadales bacterium]|nr:pre-peptidase C-terminal domain-containing protein [Capsulimonadales bacterium]
MKRIIDLVLRSGFFALWLWASGIARAQEPRIAALFPAGAKAGETVEVAMRGGNLNGAKSLIVTGAPGITAELMAAGGAVDESAKPLFEAKCTSCHEARSPANRSLTPDQWAATVDRMIRARGAAIEKGDRDKIVGYLQALARAGQVTAKFTIAPDAVPGLREVRLVTGRGASSAYLFEVGSLPEITAAEPNSKPEEAQKVTLPTVVNGVLTGASEKDFFTFAAKKGERLIFNLKSFRLNEQSQFFFNPALYLYDAGGKELAKNTGRLGTYGLDPLVDWTASADGTYTLLVRDLLWKGSPSSVYRLTMGPVPYDVVLSPEGTARPGETVPARVLADVTAMPGTPTGPVPVRVPEGADGVTWVATPLGDAPLLVRNVPNSSGPVAPAAPPVALPALFSGRIEQAGAVNTFRVKADRANTYLDVYARRIGSPLRPKVTIKNAQGNPVNGGEGDGENELRIYNAFPAPGEYTVEVTDADGRGGPSFVYSWEALNGAPDIALTALPDALNIPVGGSLPVLVRVTRRENLRGPIKVRFSGLPPGVTQTDAVLPPDDDKVMIVLTAPPGTAAVSQVVALDAETPGENNVPVVRRVRPLEEYKFNNQPRTIQRSSQIVSVGSDPVPFTLSWKDNQDSVSPVIDAKEPTKITVRVQRRPDFKAGIVVYFPAMPPGVYLENSVYIPPEKDEGELSIRANGGAQFLVAKRPMPDLPPMSMTAVGIVAGGDGSYVTCTLPLRVVGKP